MKEPRIFIENLSNTNGWVLYVLEGKDLFVMHDCRINAKGGLSPVSRQVCILCEEKVPENIQAMIAIHRAVNI